MLCEQAEESNHMGLPDGSYLENSEPKILEDFHEEGMQREPHSELEVTLRQSDITIRRSMRSLRIVRLNHLEAILPRYPCTILRHNQRLEVATTNCYLLPFSLALATRSGHLLLRGSTAPLAAGREATSGTDSMEEVLGVETSLDRGSPDMGVKAVPEIALMLLLPWLDICG